MICLAMAASAARHDAYGSRDNSSAAEYKPRATSMRLDNMTSNKVVHGRILEFEGAGYMLGKTSVCLIIPPSGFLLDDKVFMSLGVLRVAGALERGSVPVRVLDLSGQATPVQALLGDIAWHPDTVYGFTATTPQLPQVIPLLAEIRRSRPNSRVILGGPHATLVAAAAKREERDGRLGRASRALKRLLELFDVTVAGDGERAIFEACAPTAPRFINADDPNSSLFTQRHDVDTLPFPARHLVDASSYHYEIDGVPATSLIAQLGCPFKCGFCGGRLSPSFRRTRTRSVDSVLHEIRSIYESRGTRGYMFYDDELNVNTGLVDLMNGLFGLQSELGVEFALRGFVKSELFTDEQAQAMRRAGFKWILIGFESADDEVLRSIDKMATVADNTRAVEIAHRNGLKVKALMSLGHPGESEASALRISDWLVENQVDDFDLTVITVYPGTPYYDMAIHTSGDVWVYTHPKTGCRLYSTDIDYLECADFYKGVPGQYKAYVHTDFLSPQQIVDLREYVDDCARRQLGLHDLVRTAASRGFEHSMGQR